MNAPDASAPEHQHTPGRLEAALRRRRADGGKALVPYLTGGLGEWVPTVEAVAQAGAEAIEIGVPFSGSAFTTVFSMSCVLSIQPTPRTINSAFPFWITLPPTAEFDCAMAENNSPSVTL